MALEVAILDQNGVPKEQVEISLAMHAWMISVAKSLKLDLILRLNDYYADTEFLEIELPLLKAELSQLSVKTEQLQQIHDTIVMIQKIVDAAISGRQPVTVIAD